MTKPGNLFLSLALILLAAAVAPASSGSGDLLISYLALDEEGNLSANHSTFNVYQGPGLSLTNLHYLFGNGINLNANLRNIILNNRNLNLGVEKPGRFGLSLNHQQYRRIYNFNGSSFTRRHNSGGSIWIYPFRYLKIWGGGSYMGRSGSITDLFDTDPGELSRPVDYNQTDYHAGLQFQSRGRILAAEYRAADYNDSQDSNRDQKRSTINLHTLAPIPRLESVILSGGFRRFVSKFDRSGFQISSNRVWGGVTANLPRNFQARYNFIFDRSRSDSDYVATDNIANTFYLSHLWPTLAQVTVGYQNDLKDDFENEVHANSYYFSSWIKPLARLEFRGEYGLREEQVKDGSRLIGDQDRTRYKISGKYNSSKYGSVILKFEDRIRNNFNLGSKIDFIQTAADYSVTVAKYGSFSGGCSLTQGDYQNRSDKFKFTDHTLYADIRSREYRNLIGGFGATYYRSRRDLDVESFILRFIASYGFFKTYRLEVEYDVHNFDDFLVRDQFYTANIVEINLIKNISF